MKREEFHDIRRKRGRGGKSKISLFYINAHGKDNLLSSIISKQYDSLLSCNSVTMLSETWVTEEKFTPCLKNKTFFYSGATRTAKTGRASGGLELYVNPSMKAKLISSSPHHLGISLYGYSIISIYYTPSFELDDMIVDLTDAISKVPDATKVIVMGDFNIRPGTERFTILERHFESEGLFLRSDPSKATYIYDEKGSTLDHIFVTLGIRVACAQVLGAEISDHMPINITIYIPRKRLQPNYNKQVWYKKVDLEHCAANLEDLDSPTPSQLTDALKPSFKIGSTKKFDTKPWFCESLREMFTQTINLRPEPNAPREDFKRYTVARNAYHHSLRQAERLHHQAQVEQLLEGHRRGDLTDLYKKAKTDGSTSGIPLKTLEEHFKSIFSRCSPPPPPPSFEQLDLAVDQLALIRRVKEEEIVNRAVLAKSKSCGANGYSPQHIKCLIHPLSIHIAPIYTSFLQGCDLPSVWLKANVFFIHKGGSFSNANNYRSISNEDPFLKLFTSILYQRTLEFAMARDLIPTFQFGFTPGRSTMGAAALLYDLAITRMRKGERTFVAFIDYRKAFDFLDRSLLYKKLEKFGFPNLYLTTLHKILSGMTFRISADNHQTGPLKTNNGVLQGDSLSPLLFNLFVSDLPGCFSHSPPTLNNVEIPYIQYADDLVICATSADELQTALNDLHRYCDENGLEINTDKSKVMIYYMGQLPRRTREFSFRLNGAKLEKVNSFKYLGVYFSTQLRFSTHMENLADKAQARIGFLFSRLDIKMLPLETVLKIFQVYVLPMIEYGLPLWLTGKHSDQALARVNATFTKYLKRYLGVPYPSSSRLIHHLCQTRPLHEILWDRLANATGGIMLPEIMHGWQLSFANVTPVFEPYSIQNIPTSFWHSRMCLNLPWNPQYRRKISREILDSNHHSTCANRDFHRFPDVDKCICIICGQHNHMYHSLYFCNK